MKRMTRILSALLAVLLIGSVLASCSGGSDKTDSKKADEAAESKVDQTEAAQPAAVDYTDIALTIEDGDFDGIVKFLKAWESGQYDDKVIKVTGISERRVSNCTVIEKDGQGTGRGFSWEIIDGKFPDDYPAEDAKVTLVGQLKVDNQYGARKLMVPAENVTVIE